MSKLKIVSPKPREMSLRIIQPIVKDLLKNHGMDSVEALAKIGGVDPQRLIDGKNWTDFASLNAMAEAAFSSYGNDEERFRQACAQGLQNSYGPLRYLFFASSPSAIFQKAVASAHTVSEIGSWKIHKMGIGQAHASYFSSKKESRALCLIRQANVMALPTLWNLPQATVTEKKCIAWGDKSCEIETSWAAPWRWLWTLLSTASASLLALMLSTQHMLPENAFWFFPAAGLVAGLAWEWHHKLRVDAGYRLGVERSITEMTEAEAAARQEVEALLTREAHWQEQLHQDLVEHQQALQNMRDKIEKIQQDQVLELHHYTHDIRNPLTGFRMLIDILKDERQLLSQDGRWALDEQEVALRRIHSMLDSLLETATQTGTKGRGETKDLELAPMVETYRRRLKAFVGRRPVHTSVIDRREMPTKIRTDPQRFERILDNLISNAAKYTARGHIMMEFTGTARFLVVKILDTGVGIDQEKIPLIFSAQATPSEQSDMQSFGVGLSVAVRILDEVGGHLEVLSKPGEGTTFLVYFPNEVQALTTSNKDEPESAFLSRVVNIREHSKA